MAVLPRRPRLLALVWLAVALLLAATSGCLCRSVPSGAPSRALLSTPSSSPPPPSPDTPAPPPPFHFPRPICRLCPPRCPPEGCSGTGGSP
ncbi:hypothetical protein SEVIR_1G037500v4 [Setaria viridis]|uniref:Epidermal patterning factor-like protein n=1 Tax=Setaria italica TaxID=4555 RepID=K3Z178_SETIT|nr:late cornified envelope-like proline-rich protein 1 [Setaria italica]XP_034579151.1 late cornified envelope-like proline-rich protein 1 [Setaria viridis]RCV04899.1 hypothetical protein SETIT_1G038400v2 [Setaria italica]